MNYGKSAYLKVIELEKKLSSTNSSASANQGYIEFDKTNLAQVFTDQNSYSASFPSFDVTLNQELCFEIKVTMNATTAGTFNVGLNLNNSRIYSESKTVTTGFNDFIMFKTFTSIADENSILSLDFSSDTAGFSATIDDIKVIILGLNDTKVNTDIEMRALKVADNKVLISYIDSDKLYYNISNLTAGSVSSENFSLLGSAISHCFTLDTLTTPQAYDQSKVFLLRVDTNKNLYISNYFVNQTETLIDTSVSYVYATACPSSMEDTLLIVYVKNGEIYYTSLKNGTILTSKKLGLISSNCASVFAVTRNDSEYIYIIASDKNNSNYIVKSVVARELCDTLDNISVNCEVAISKYVDLCVDDEDTEETIKVNAAFNISLKTLYNTLIENQSTDAIHANVNMQGETYELEENSTVLYGVKLDTTLNNNEPLGTSWATYTDDAVGLSGAYMDFANDVFVDNGWYNRWPFNAIKPCIVKDGAVVGYLKKNDYTQYENGTSAPITDRTAGNVMIEVPKIYYKISSDNQYNYIQISNQTFNGACCLGHTYKGEELSKVYVDAYLSGGSDWSTYGPYSNSGTEPAPYLTNISYTNMYPKIKTFRGQRCEPMTYNLYTLFCCLYTIMFKNTNSRESLGVGLYKYTTVGVFTGVLNQKGFCYGENTNEEDNATKGRIKLFGMEDFYGGRQTIFSGMYIDTSNNLRILDPTSATSSYAPEDLGNMPIAISGTNASTDPNYPYPNTTDYSPVHIAGINSYGFLRTNQNTSATNVSSNEDVGFCSKTKMVPTNTNYKVGVFGRGFPGNNFGGQGVFSMQVFTAAATNRRAFRIVYFPEEN